MGYSKAKRASAAQGYRALSGFSGGGGLAYCDGCRKLAFGALKSTGHSQRKVREAGEKQAPLDQIYAFSSTVSHTSLALT